MAMRRVSSDGAALTAASLVERPHLPAHQWQLVGGKNWQIVSTDSEDVVATDAQEGTRGDCPAGMVEVRGQMKLDGPPGPIEYLQEQACTSWMSRSFPERCAAFDPEKWQSLARDLPTRPMHFCIDRFEYPNVRGDYPVIMVTWHEGASYCEQRGARLCTEDEWTFACEGEDALPFATGYVRDESACVLDRSWRLVHEESLSDRTGASALNEVDDLWQGQASGSSPRCRSPFGVYDMTGNVDEWTVSTKESGLRSILKGGYWGPVRTQCRPSTRVHNEDFYFYQIGFRCCTNAPPGPDE
jgi:formylglycine-generating enzyme required for sulfatase activity